MKRVVTMFALVAMVTAVGLISSGCSTMGGWGHGKQCGHGGGSCGTKMEKACCGTCKGDKAACKAGKKAACKAKKACCGTCKAEKPAGDASEAKAACPAGCTKPCCAKQ